MQLKVLQKRYKAKNKVTLCALIIIQVLKPVSVENITCYDTLIINVEIKQKPHYSEVKLKIYPSLLCLVYFVEIIKNNKVYYILASCTCSTRPI